MQRNVARIFTPIVAPHLVPYVEPIVASLFELTIASIANHLLVMPFLVLQLRNARKLGPDEIIREQCEIRSWSLRETQRPRASIHEAVASHRSKQMREIVARRSPHPRYIPPHTRALGRRESPMNFLDQAAPGRGDEHTHTTIRARDCADRRAR